MAKDTLNKSRLSDKEEELMQKVLSCEQYSPSRVCKLLNYADNYFSDRVQFTLIMSPVIVLITYTTGSLNNFSAVYMLQRLLIGLFLHYLLCRLIVPDSEIKQFMHMLRRIL